MTREKLGHWKDTVVTPDKLNHGVYFDIRDYKLFDAVMEVPLYVHIDGMDKTRPIGFNDEDISTIPDLFEELRTFISKNPKYIDVLYSEIDGFPNLEWYLIYTSTMNEVTDVFHDMPVVGNIRTSWNNIRMLWYLKNIHENIRPVWEFDNIIDFGAGTGHFIKHCYQVGFKGEVQIVDIPQTVPIQKHVLRGLNVRWVEGKQLLTNLPNTLFNSTWGFSETPLVVRDELPDISNCSKFIAFQHNFEGIDNKKDILERFKGKEPPILRNISILAPWDGGSTFLMSKSFI